MEKINYDYLVKLLLVGDSGVGKSSLLLRFDENKFTSNFMSTVGIDFRMKMLEVDNKMIKLQIWDTAGQERFKTITQAYFRGATAIILVYDVTDPFSFDNIRNWLTTIEKSASENVTLVLVATKTDLNQQRIISIERGKALADDLGIKFYETSSKLGTGVNELFSETVNQVVKKLSEDKKDNHNNHNTVKFNNINNDIKKDKNDCCTII